MGYKMNHGLSLWITGIFLIVLLSGCSSEPFRVVDYFFDRILSPNNPKSKEIWEEAGLQEETLNELEEAIARAKKENEVEKEAESEAELMEGFEEQAKLIPDFPISYKGDIEGVAITLVVDFQSETVTGSLILSGDDYANAEINGGIDIASFKVAATFSGIMGNMTYGRTLDFNGVISGKVSEDLGTFEGVLVDDEGQAIKFRALR